MTGNSKHQDKTASVELVERRLGRQNSKLCLYLDWIRNQAGVEVREYFTVTSCDHRERDAIHPLSTPTGVGILPIREGQVGLIRTFRHPIRDWVWEVPRGFADENEDIRTAATRELLEETGLECAPDDMVELGFHHPEAGILRARIAIYAATRCALKAEPETGEIGLGDLAWIPFDTALAMADQSEIQDPTTCIALYRLLRIGHIDARKDKRA
ncbi:NUDIX hydrolase [Paramagnetospirillum magneticum]|uniref:GDP-mannose pyrophosphatase n=1 Tax=Paramagnetospirillum magneticum (strain ATCC 700264 / AMB-1) TaxID=342108 RepID=Q2W8F5_PARM1|nr:NUDIX hydrolase [Paramagnetospirillum magneticum]BAE49870.1 NTP pyrophosphohydrolase [Paramagnetospirillum magneticum AMB-1]